MMKKDKNEVNALKQALENRRGPGLPSNFSFMMMEKVRLEAEKKRKRIRNIVWISLGSASVFIFAMLGYVLYAIDFNLAEYMPEVNLVRPPGEIMDFYYYIGFLVIVLLGLDYWMRNKRRKYLDE